MNDESTDSIWVMVRLNALQKSNLSITCERE
jgi:hypothetical protein